jgi:hypothetical protein
MYVDNNLYLMKTGGRPCDNETWANLYAATTNYSASIDLAMGANRVIAEAGYLVWRQGVAETMTATGTMEVQLVSSAAAALGSDTILWSTGVMVHATIVATFLINTIVYVIKMPRKIPLRYFGVAWVVGTDVMETTTADIFITPNAPYPAK